MPYGANHMATKTDYRSFSGGGTSIYFAKSCIDAPVEAKILEILFVDGHRG